jgi:TrmH family RNA methyltransferase
LKRRRSISDARAVAVEGAWALRQARAASVALDVAFVCPELAQHDDVVPLVRSLLDVGTEVLAVGEPVLRRMVDRHGPDGLADDLSVGRATRVVIAADIEHAGNLGTLIRTADGAGASAVILTGGRIRPTHPLVVRASIGTAFTVPLVEAEASELVAWLRRHGVHVVAADPSADTSYRDVAYRRPLAVVVGNERLGLEAWWREAADHVVSIPMLGSADSLNVAVAAALVLYEATMRKGGSELARATNDTIHTRAASEPTDTSGT